MINKDLEKIFDFIQLLQKLKEYKRWESTPTFIIKESIADHIWKASIMHFVVYRNLDLSLDFLRIIKLVLVHDLVEAIAEDTDYRLVYLWLVSKEDKHQKELDAMEEIRLMLPEDVWSEILWLWSEYENWTTPEARFVKSLEKIESIDHVIYYWHEYVDIPDKMATYCDKTIEKTPELKWYYDWQRSKLKEIFSDWWFEWKETYDTKWDFEEFKDFWMIFEFFQLAQKLKETMRYWSSPLITKKDTVAEHCFRLAFIVLIVQEEMKLEIDLLKALSIALFHDIAESLAWEIDYILIFEWKITKEEKHKNELEAMDKIRLMLPEKIWSEIYGLWDEYEKWETKEAKFVKALDKFESISHLLYFW
jgi:5'-deoxynucleotidase YfbR-like HD superfamily hydrolase